MLLRSAAEMFDGLPILTLQASPLYGWSRVIKRVMDIGLSALILVVASPLMFTIAIAISIIGALGAFLKSLAEIRGNFVSKGVKSAILEF